MAGYVLIHRALIGNPQFRGKDDEYAAMWLIARAAWEPTTKRIAGQSVNLERGQVCDAISELAKWWECSKSTAHARLRLFEKVGFLRTEVRTGLTFITLCNYEQYQDPSNGGRTQDRTLAERDPNAVRTNIDNTRNTLNAGKASGRQRGTRLSLDWRPDEGDLELGRSLGLGDDEILGSVPEFRDYWIGVPGQRGTKLDWHATFRNNLRRVAPRIIAARNPGASGGKPNPGGIVASLGKVRAARANSGPDDGKVRF